MSEKIEQEIEATEEDIETLQDRFQTLQEQVENLREQQIGSLAEKIDVETSDVDIDELQDFLQRPYLVNEAGDDKYEVVVPAFLDFQVGRLDRQVENYNVFVVDKYTKWMTGVPDFLADEIDLDDDSRFKVSGDVLEYSEEQKEVVEQDRDIQQHVSDVEDTKATVKQGHEFELVADLIEKGDLPFTPQPVADDDIREPKVEFELKDFQQEGYERFLENGSACFCWMTGAGKSFPAMYALDSLRYDEEDAKKAVVVYGKATEQQWNQYFEEYAPRLKDEVEVVTYQSLHKLDGDYILIVYDECHALPADTFAKGATIPTKYRIGLTASPYREDGRQNYIFALTGTPVGLDWEKTLDLMDKTYHEINIHVVEDRREKIKRIKDILDDRRTLVFCDSLDFGEEIAEETGLTFVSGEDTNQLDKIQENEQVVVSRIGDHGISLENLEVVLEADFLYGSRRQQIQRTGRLFHGEGERHDIFFTKGEFNKYQKRLYSLIEKGFTLNFVDEGEELEVPDKYRSRVDLDLADTSAGSARHGVGVDEEIREKEDFLRNEEIKAEIESLIEESKAGRETCWDVLVCFVEYGSCSVNELSKYTGTSDTSVRRVLKPFKERNPPLIREDSSGEYDLNTGALEEILEAKQERERIQNLRQDLIS